jgi:hypothetical protein
MRFFILLAGLTASLVLSYRQKAPASETCAPTNWHGTNCPDASQLWSHYHPAHDPLLKYEILSPYSYAAPNGAARLFRALQPNWKQRLMREGAKCPRCKDRHVAKPPPLGELTNDVANPQSTTKQPTAELEEPPEVPSNPPVLEDSDADANPEIPRNVIPVLPTPNEFDIPRNVIPAEVSRSSMKTVSEGRSFKHLFK